MNDEQIKDTIAGISQRREKVSWNRKMNNMTKLLDQIRPIEDQIIELQAQKIPIFDEIQTLRELMIKECIHPSEFLEVHDTYVECKFCGKRISKPS